MEAGEADAAGHRVEQRAQRLGSDRPHRPDRQHEVGVRGAPQRVERIRELDGEARVAQLSGVEARELGRLMAVPAAVDDERPHAASRSSIAPKSSRSWRKSAGEETGGTRSVTPAWKRSRSPMNGRPPISSYAGS